MVAIKLTTDDVTEMIGWLNDSPHSFLPGKSREADRAMISKIIGVIVYAQFAGRSLISASPMLPEGDESSGDKEQETDPFLSNLYGVKSAPSPAPINAEISGVDFTQPGAKLVIHPDPRFGFPAPLPKEVEAAMETLGERGKVNKILKGCSQEHIEGPTYWDANDDAALALREEKK